MPNPPMLGMEKAGLFIVSNAITKRLQPLNKFSASILIFRTRGMLGMEKAGLSIVLNVMMRPLQPLNMLCLLIPLPLIPGMGKPTLSAS